MDESLIQQIWRACRIAFALAGPDLVVRSLHGLTEIFGAPGQACLGCSLYDLFPELVGREEDLQAILGGRLDSLKLAYINRETPEGETRYLTMEDLPYRDGEGRITGILHLVQDITSQGALEQQVTQNRNLRQLVQEWFERQNQELVAANLELRRLSELKTQFISIAAHELRSPLTALNGYLEMLADGQMGPLTPKQRAALATMQKSGYSLSYLAEQLLNAARLEAGRVDLVLQPVDLAGLAREVADTFAGQVAEKAQRLSLELPPGLPPALCDENFTRQIVTNLLSNACKFTPEQGSIRLRLGLAGDPGYLELAVIDTGIGIPAKDLEKIYDPWFRAGNAAVVSTHGSGLGLYITHALVELHNGAIWIDSQPGQGSVFHVTLPVAG